MASAAELDQLTIYDRDYNAEDKSGTKSWDTMRDMHRIWRYVTYMYTERMLHVRDDYVHEQAYEGVQALDSHERESTPRSPLLVNMTFLLLL